MCLKLFLLVEIEFIKSVKGTKYENSAQSRKRDDEKRGVFVVVVC